MPDNWFSDFLEDAKRQQPPEGHCLSPAGWLHVVCPHGTQALICLRCHRCTACRRVERAKALRRINYGCEFSTRTAFLTLTTKLGADWPQIMRAWSSMARWIRRKNPAMAYVAVKETGKRHGMKHLHLLLANWSYIPQPQISKEWRKLTGSYVCDIRVPDTYTAVAYIAKYIKKSFLPVGKTITYSRYWPKCARSNQLRVLGRWKALPDWLHISSQTPSGVLFLNAAPACDCFAEDFPITYGERLWLAFRSDPSPPPYRVAAAERYFALRDSGWSPSNYPLNPLAKPAL
jgi:hypothetical protein